MNNARKVRSGLIATLFVCAIIVVVRPQSANANSAPAGAAYLMDEDFTFMSGLLTGELQPSGWDVRAAGGKLISVYSTSFRINDTSTALPVSMNKKFVSQSDGVITMEYRFKPVSIIDSVKWQLLEDDVAGVSIVTSGSNLRLETSGGNYVTLQAYSAGVEYGVKAVVNLDTQKTDVYINGVLKASAANFKNTVTALDHFQIETGEASRGEIYFAPLKIYKGYTVNERLLSVMPGFLPEGWTATPSGGSITVAEMLSSPRPDVNSLKLDATSATSSMNLAKSFATVDDDFSFEFKIFVPQKTDGLDAELKSGSTTVLRMTTSNGKLTYMDDLGQPVELYDYKANLWYHIRVKVDASASTADIYINGKLKEEDAKLAATVTSVDGMQFSTSATHKGVMWLDDILLYEETPLPVDYVPEPVQLNTEDPLIGAQSCPMWREGHHLGWDLINPFPDRTPLLGFYDEGNSETADWEIKWMVEHGIDFQMSCWFRPIGGEGSPVKDSYLSYALHDGYFNAQYSDLMKFAIMWENMNSKAQDSNDFRTNLVPYWIEYYFKDPRYLKIDNKPVFTIYNYEALLRDFGTVAGAEAEIDYLRDAVIAAGFDDLILLNVYNGTKAQDLINRRTVGFDAVYSYSWGSFGGHPDFQKLKLTQENAFGELDVIPGLSMGRDDTAWGLSSGYYATPTEFQSLLQWTKDMYIPSLSTGNLGKKLVMLDNWNEFGEGHFIMPAGLNGFGYVDAIRNVFVDDNAHTDAVPTAAQKERIGVLYPDGRVISDWTLTPPAITNVYHDSWEFNTDGDSEGWTVLKQIDSVSIANGSFTGTTTDWDPGIISGDHLGIIAEDVPYLKIRMKNSANDIDGRVFFTTELDGEWNEAKAMGFYVNPNDSGYTDYYVEMWRNKNWTGNIRQIRIDPISAIGTISIDYIRTVYSPTQDIKLYMDGQLKKFNQPAVVEDNMVMVPIRNVFGQMGVKSEWDAATQTITAVKGSNVYRLTVGSSTAYKDNGTITLEHAPVILTNGTVLVPLSYLEQVFGAIVNWDEDEQRINIYTTAVVWDFSFSEGWTANGQISDVEVAGGQYNGTSEGVSGGIEPALLSPDELNLAASAIKRIRIKYSNQTSGDEAKVYYTTTTDTVWNELKLLTSYVLPNDPEYREYVFDTSDVEDWEGLIKQIQFVPTTVAGDFSIEYVQLDTTQAIPLLGDNLIPDPGMEGSTVIYSGSNSVRTLDTTQYHSGHQSMKVTKQSHYGSIQFPVNVVQGQEYHYSAWAKLAPTSTPNEVIRICLQYKLDGVIKQIIIFTSAGLNAQEWKQVQGNYTIDEPGVVTDVVMFMYTEIPGLADIYYVDDVSVRPISYSTSPTWVHPTGLSLNKTATTAYLGKIETLVPTFQPLNVSNKEIIWRSDNPAVAIVDINGTVYGKSVGTANITATTVDGGQVATTSVTVEISVPVTGVSLNTTTVSLLLGSTETLTATVLPANATNQMVTWSTSNANIAMVDAAGTVTSISPGTAQITARAVDGGLTAVATVTVSLPANGVQGSNLIIDPGMEGSTLHSSYTGNTSTLSLTTTEHRNGLQSLKVTKLGFYGAVNFPVSIEQDKAYYYSAWAKLDPTSTMNEVIRICLQYKVDGVLKQRIVFQSAPLNDTEWKQVQGVFTIHEPGVVTDTLMFLYTEIPGMADIFYVDDVEVREISYAVTGVNLNKSTAHIDKGQTETLLATVLPTHSTNKSVTWSSSNPTVATVDSNGTVTAVVYGVATITVTTADGNFQESATVTVNEVVPVEVQFKDSSGNPISGGVVKYYDGGWKDFGVIDASGHINKSLVENSYTFSITYMGKVNEKVQNVGTNAVIVFQTVKAQVQLKDSLGTPLDGATVEVFTGGSWVSVGNTSYGEVSKELLPSTYTFRMTHEGKNKESTQNIGTSAVIAFNTVKVRVQLKDNLGNLIDTGTVKFYSGGSWRTIGNTAGGEISKELFDTTYTFGMTHNGFYQEKLQDTAADAVVVFLT
jgi:uncharacterized protein YjdB